MYDTKGTRQHAGVKVFLSYFSARRGSTEGDSMYCFFVRVFAAGDAPTSAAPLPVAFEEALAALSQLPHLFAEPDGSFVWRSPAGDEPHWQVDGNLIDRGETLFYAEIKGKCPASAFDQLLACVTEAGTPLAYEWVERGLLMNDATFRRSAENPAFNAIPHGD